jgi:TRAP-type C4-dicarboxylate transport system substrate-binding protein
MEEAVKEAVTYQRELALLEERDAEQAIREAGCEIVVLTDQDRLAFIDAVNPLLAEAEAIHGPQLMALLPR